MEIPSLDKKIAITQTFQDFTAFCKDMLGITLHPKQDEFARESYRLVNILKPGNQWGKTVYLALKHIWHGIAKPKVQHLTSNWEDWMGVEYLTLNGGKNYEMAKAVYHTELQIAQGRFMFPDGSVNESKIGHLIEKAPEAPMPEIRWTTGARNLFRSYDDLGASFKMQRLAYASIDEVGDIPHLIEFLNGTLLPRIVRMQGTIDLVGTPQDPAEYFELVEMAQRGEGDYYVQDGTMYENPFLDKKMIEKIENTADPELRQRIIYGKFVDYGDKYFSYQEVSNMFDEDIVYQRKSSDHNYMEVSTREPTSVGRYCLTYDPAAGDKNYSVLSVIRYDKFPYQLEYHCRFLGSKYPMSTQYQMVRDLYWKYKRVSQGVSLIFDSGGPSGKNARDYLEELKGFAFPGKRMYGDVKAEALGRLKSVLSKNRLLDDNGMDLNPRWGGLKCPKIRELRLELEGYKLEDSKIIQDQVMAFAMACWWIELKKPAGVRKRAVDFDFVGM